MKNHEFLMISILVLILCLCNHNVLLAWNDTNTHPQITRYVFNNVATNQDLVDFLFGKLGFQNKINEGFYEKYSNGKPKGKPLQLIDIIADGAKSEDLAKRGFNHFYDPVAGNINGGGLLHDYAYNFEFKGNQSNVVWAIVKGFCERPVDDKPDENSNTCNDFSWIKARDAFRMALTSKTNEDRDKMFIRSFRSLGQVVHLMQDMAVPAHVRNDMKGHVFA